MSKILMCSILTSFMGLSVANAEKVVEPVIIVEDTGPGPNVSQPFMSCSWNDEEVDFTHVTLTSNSLDPSTGSVISMRNPEYDEDVIYHWEFGDSEGDYSDFNLSPIGLISNDLVITPVEGTRYLIEGGFVGFTQILQQEIDIASTKGKLVLTSALGGDETFTLECSIYPRVLEYLFEN